MRGFLLALSVYGRMNVVTSTAVFCYADSEELMSLTPEDAQKIAHLARLAITDDEAVSVAENLSSILHLVEQMDHVDTSDVMPMSHPLHMTQRLRPDEVSEENQRDRFQSIAPAVENGLYLVPRVIE